MKVLKRYLIWLLRWRHCRGFGIQSPTDYAFVRYVVNEHYPYYAYSELKNIFPALSVESRKLMELYFRISNWLQPNIVYLSADIFNVASSYIEAGCRKTQIKEMERIENIEGNTSLTILGKEVNDSSLQKSLDGLSCSSILIVEDVYGTNKDLWRFLINEDRVRVSYDLYYAGIAIFTQNRFKTNYIINF